MKRFDQRAIIVLLLTGTLCLLLVLTAVAWIWVGPERVPASSRDHVAKIIILIVGIVSGYLMGQRNGNGPRPGNGNGKSP